MDMFLCGIILLVVTGVVAFRVNKTSYALVVPICFFVGGLALLVMIWGMNVYAQAADVEIWNGMVNTKHRVHDSYTRRYDCNCHQVCSGSGKDRSCSNRCDTCTEEHYTVKWWLNTTIGKMSVKELDSTSQSVYNAPDPQLFIATQPGQPVAKTHTYMNWVKANEHSILNQQAMDMFKQHIPPYPSGVYNLYQVDRVLWVNMPVVNAQRWNNALAEMLKLRGNSEQVNVVLVFANLDDSMYSEALEAAWNRAKKNDVVIVVGVTAEFNEPKWVRVFSWTDAAEFKIMLADELLTTPLNHVDFMRVIGDNIDKRFVRKQMKDFAYMQGMIELPWWAVMIYLAMLCGAAVWTVASYGYSGYNNRKKFSPKSFRNFR
jgi:hypothetical protein